MAIDRGVTSQDISWFLDLNRNKQLNIDPSYQRRSVWTSNDRRFFLDTIFRGYPSPPIFLHKEITDGRTIYSVVDGKQRLETIIKFSENEIAMSSKYGDGRLDGKKWEGIRLDDALAHTFWDYVVPVQFINVFEGTNYLNEVFDRLNRNSRRLVDQELRHAKYSGWFIGFVENESEDSDWETLGVVSAARAKRMADVQFLSELLIVLLTSAVNGFDQDAINSFYASYEEPLETVDFNEQDIKKRFSTAKKYLLKMEQCNSAISKYAKDFNNLYTLWTVIALKKRLPGAQAFAKKYANFMNDVAKFKDSSYLESVIRNEATPAYRQSLIYYRNSTGASTDLRQRLERYNAVASVILGKITQ